MNRSERVIRNEDLQKVVSLAKEKGYKVYTFESVSNNKTIEQVFIEHTDGRIGSCSTYYGGIKFSTIHKPKRGSGLGDGFGQLVEGEDFNNPQNIDVCFITYPYWFRENKSVEKYKSFQEYASEEKILKYFEI